MVVGPFLLIVMFYYMHKASVLGVSHDWGHTHPASVGRVDVQRSSTGSASPMGPCNRARLGDAKLWQVFHYETGLLWKWWDDDDDDDDDACVIPPWL